jgi:GTPase SAR1 family protein
MTTRFAQVLAGPAGSGKSTYIKMVSEHYASMQRTVHCVNLDPAVEYLQYAADVDVRSAVTVKDIMQRYKFGPNGALICCMELIARDANQWFSDAIGEHEYDYLLIDLPGQIELYSHMDVLSDLFRMLQRKGYNLIVVFCVDAQFMNDAAKFLSGSLVALSTMTMLQLPQLNILTKCDLLTDESRRTIDWFTEMETDALAELVKPSGGIEGLTQRICEVIDRYHLVQFHMLNIKDSEALPTLLAEIDMILQYYESVDYSGAEFAAIVDEAQPEFPPGFEP